jgi:NADH-quinone oxidoreductase subunit J
MGLTIAFWVMAAVAVLSALAVVSLRSVFRTALALVACFLAVAGLFITLSADFLGTVQVLLYVGAVAILLIIAIMLIKEEERGNNPGRFRLPAMFVAILFTGIGVWGALNTSWPSSPEAPLTPTSGPLGTLLLNQGGLALLMEIAALLLLATLIGAISMAREN